MSDANAVDQARSRQLNFVSSLLRLPLITRPNHSVSGIDWLKKVLNATVPSTVSEAEELPAQ
jgi:hypothetical protein